MKSIQNLVKLNYPHFGLNKKQEITRLCYEISKREDVSPARIIQDENSAKDYPGLKKALLARRYPYAFGSQESLRPYLPKIELKPGNARIKKKKFYPRRIFIEKEAYGLYLAQRFKGLFSRAGICEIASLKDYLRSNKGFGIEEYNQRQDTVFIVNENYDFFKKCPCTRPALPAGRCAIGCGYHIFNLGFGCIYECSYCYLQEYVNSPGIILPANIDKFFDVFASYKFAGMRLGSGEFSDSLALDGVTGYSLRLIDFFNNHPDVTFEFKTKSIEIDNLLKASHAGNIVVSWSLNPQDVIEENEFFSSSLKERLAAARQCINAGYRVGFHLDPVIYFPGWQNEYANLLEAIFSQIKPVHIAWISIGTLRFRPELKPVIENRFPANKILDEELLLGYDNKLRYPYKIRYEIYKFMIARLRKHSSGLHIYLCMEEEEMCRDLGLINKNN